MRVPFPLKPRSLQQNLLLWAMGALVVVWVGFVAFGFRTGVHEADELTDGHLAGVVTLLLRERDGHFVEPAETDPAARPDLRAHDYQQSMSVVIWDGSGRVLTHTGDAPVPAFDVEEGFADLRLGDPPRRWRSFARWDGPQHERRVMVLLNVRERDDLAWDIAEQVAEPGLWLLPVTALVLGFAIRRGLRPLRELARDVHALDPTQAAALPAKHPEREFKEVVEAINLLLQRLQEQLQRERELAGELAHELRTPLASLALHARTLRGELEPAERQASLERLERDALHAGEVLTQLLSLARASREQIAAAAEPFDLGVLARRVVADYADKALATGHDLSLAGSDAFPLHGHALLVELALRNLIENALGHTPRGTAVEVQLDRDARWLQVCDDGCSRPLGAPVASAEPRPALNLGLGLGHRVVAKIAAMHGAAFEQAAAPPGFSACYRIRFG